MAATFAAFVLQTSLVPLGNAGTIQPNFVLGGLVWMVWRAGPRTGLLSAAAWGAIADGLAQGPLGIDLIGYTMAAWIVQLVRDRGTTGSVLRVVGVTGSVVLAVSAASAGAREFIERQEVDSSLLLAWAGGQALATAMLAALLVMFRNLVFGHSAETGGRTKARVSNQWRMLTE
jgi:rod shape-determining protein MreD